MKLRRRTAPLPVSVAPIPTSLGGALIAYCDDGGRPLACGTYRGEWELNDGFRNLTSCTLLCVAHGTATQSAMIDVAHRQVISTGAASCNRAAVPGDCIVVRPGDLVLHPLPIGAADDLLSAVLAIGTGTESQPA